MSIVLHTHSIQKGVSHARSSVLGGIRHTSHRPTCYSGQETLVESIELELCQLRDYCNFTLFLEPHVTSHAAFWTTTQTLSHLRS